METAAIDFMPWGLDASWPSRRWLEVVDGRRGGPPKGVRLGHASESALVLVCTYPRARFDADLPGQGTDLVRELAFESMFALINITLHQIRGPERRPDGLVGSLVNYANEQADRYPDWTRAYWGIGRGAQPEAAGQYGFSLPEQARGGLRVDMTEARTTTLAGWQSGFSTGDPETYIVVHACGVSLDQLQLSRVTDQAAYGLSASPATMGDMHWELWSGQRPLRYADLASQLTP